MNDETVTVPEDNSTTEFSMYNPNAQNQNYSLYTNNTSIPYLYGTDLPATSPYANVPQLSTGPYVSYNPNQEIDYTVTGGPVENQTTTYAQNSSLYYTNPSSLPYLYQQNLPPANDLYTNNTSIPYLYRSNLPATSPYYNPNQEIDYTVTGGPVETNTTGNQTQFLGPYSAEWYAAHAAQQEAEAGMATIPTFGTLPGMPSTYNLFNNQYSLLTDDSIFDKITENKTNEINEIIDFGWEDIDLSNSLEQFKDIFSAGSLDIFDLATPLQDALKTAKEAIEQLALDVADEYGRVSAQKELIMIERERQARLAEQNGSN